ncbi:MAG: hypothetical protein KatS3mg032_1087 [Cyclobacteriaceae bacterium]|nr:MAG: hypothetical protein KatS3mg032_1087 [Cyclobacteriaceae bacterium]
MPIRITVPVVLFIGLVVARLWVGMPVHSHKASVQTAPLEEHTLQYRFQGNLMREDSVRAELLHLRKRTQIILSSHLDGGRLMFTFTGRPEKGVYMLDDSFSAYAELIHPDDSCRFVTDHYYQGILMIEAHDAATGMLKGTFEFLAWSDECRQVVRAQEGRFNVRYHERDIR